MNGYGDMVHAELVRYGVVPGSPEPPALIVEHARDLLACHFIGLEWLVDRLMPRVGVMVLAGAPKSFKTFLGLQLAITVGAPDHPDFLGRDVRSGPVVFLEQEGSRRSYVERLRTMTGALGCDQPNIQFVLHQRVLLDDDASVARLASLARETRPALVVIDPLVYHHGGEENSNTDMARAMRPLTEIAAETESLCLVLHHTTKPQADGRPSRTGERLRGASSLAAATDGNLILDREGDRRARLRGDLRDGERVDMYLEFDPVSLLLTPTLPPGPNLKIDPDSLLSWVTREGSVTVGDAVANFGVATNTARDALERELKASRLDANKAASPHVYSIKQGLL